MTTAVSLTTAGLYAVERIVSVGLRRAKICRCGPEQGSRSRFDSRQSVRPRVRHKLPHPARSAGPRTQASRARATRSMATGSAPRRSRRICSGESLPCGKPWFVNMCAVPPRCAWTTHLRVLGPQRRPYGALSRPAEPALEFLRNRRSHVNVSQAARTAVDGRNTNAGQRQLLGGQLWQDLRPSHVMTALR